MIGRRRTVGLMALVAFLAITAWSVGLVPSPCCSATCERCPITFCTGTTAESSPKGDTAPASAPAEIPLPVLGGIAAPLPVIPQISSFLSHEFRRPMRN